MIPIMSKVELKRRRKSSKDGTLYNLSKVVPIINNPGSYNMCAIYDENGREVALLLLGHMGTGGENFLNKLIAQGNFDGH